MNAMDIFLTNLEQLEDGLLKIRSSKIPEIFNREFLETLEITEPNSVLFTELFKVFGLIDQQGRPTSEFEHFAESEETAREVVANKMAENYQNIFADEPDAHLLPKEEIREVFRKQLKGSKSETYTRMVADTFAALAEFADWDASTDELADEQSFDSGPEDEPEEMNQGDEQEIEDILQNAELQEEETANAPVVEESSANESIQAAVSAMGDLPENGNGTSGFMNPEHVEPSTENPPDQIPLESKRQESDAPLGHAENLNESGERMNSQLTPELEENLSKAINRKAELLLRLERYQEALNAYDQMIRFYEKAKNDTPEADIAQAIMKKAEIHEQLGQHDEALTAYDNFINRLSDKATQSA